MQKELDLEYPYENDYEDDRYILLRDNSEIFFADKETGECFSVEVRSCDQWITAKDVIELLPLINCKLREALEEGIIRPRR